MTSQPQGLHSLSTILKRLEAVTSRLEDVATSQSSHAPTSALRSGTGGAHDLVAGHVAPGSSAPPPPPPPPPASASTETTSSPAVKAYQDDILDGTLAELLSASKNIGGVVEQHTALLKDLCTAQLAFLQLASQHAKPSSPNGLGPLLKPQADAISAVMEAKDKLGRGKEGREWGACLSTIGEGVSAWGWVQVEPAPAPFVGEMKNAAQFWADRVTKQFKETNPAVPAWSKLVIAVIDSLQKYVKQWHTTGVAWNPQGAPAPASFPSSSGASTGAGGPPPPPPPPPATTAPSSSTSAPAGGQAALLAELNRGGNVTSGLKKVDASQMTHKNPELRTSSVVPDKKSPPEVKAKPGALSQAPKKPARTELEEGNKWIVENHEDNKDIQITDTQLHHAVHIFGCKNSVIRISGKVNAISMVGCRKTSIVLESALSSLSITSSPSFEVQVTGSVPTVQIDTTDSGQVYLSQACMETVEIITSKTSSINISVPTGEGGDYEERPVPEQMKSRLVKGKLVTEIVEHAG